MSTSDRRGSLAVGARRGRRPPMRAAALAVLAAWVAAGWASGVPRTAAGPGLVGGLELVGHAGGAVRTVVAASNTVWVGQGIGVAQIDVRDPQDPRERWRVVLGDGADVWRIARVGRYVLAATATGVYAVDPGAGVIDRVVGHVGTGRPARGLTALAGPDEGPWRALVVAPGGDVAVVEVSATGGLSMVATIPDTAEAAVDAAADGSRAVLAAGDVRFLDVSDPLRPREMARLDTAGHVRGVAARDGLAFIADSVDGLVVHALDETAAPIGRLPGVAAGRIALHGSLLFLVEQHGDAANTVRLIDVADPSAPRDVLGGESTYGVLRGAQDLAFSSELCLAARGHSLVVADVGDVHWPAVKAVHWSGWPMLDVAPAGDCVYVAHGQAGLGVIDVRTPAAPAPWAAWRPDGGVGGVHVAGGFAYVAAANGASRIDVREACEPVAREVPFAADWPATPWMDASGSLLAATSAQRLHLARIDGEAAPEEIASLAYGSLVGWPSSAVVQGIALAPEVAYLAAGPAGVVVLALEEPEAPGLARVVAGPEGISVLAVAVSGSWLAAGTTDGVLLYDVATSRAPRLVGVHTGGYVARSLAFPTARRLFVAADLDGLLALDLEDPTRPVLRADWRPPFAVSAVAVDERDGDPARGGHLFAAAAGLAVVVDRTGSVGPTATTTPTASPTVTGTPAEWPWTIYAAALVQGDVPLRR